MSFWDSKTSKTQKKNCKNFKQFFEVFSNDFFCFSCHFSAETVVQFAYFTIKVENF